MALSIRTLSLTVFVSLLLTACTSTTQVGQVEQGGLKSYLLGEAEVPMQITGTSQDPVFFGLDNTLFPGGDCDSNFSEMMLKVDNSESATYTFSEVGYEDFYGYLNQQVFSFDGPGMADDLLETVRNLAIPGKCESEKLWGNGYVDSSRPFVNLPEPYSGLSWEQSWIGGGECSSGIYVSYERLHLLTNGNLVIINKTGVGLCQDIDDYEKIHNRLDEIQKTLADALVAKL